MLTGFGVPLCYSLSVRRELLHIQSLASIRSIINSNFLNSLIICFLLFHSPFLCFLPPSLPSSLPCLPPFSLLSLLASFHMSPVLLRYSKQTLNLCADLPTPRERMTPGAKCPLPHTVVFCVLKTLGISQQISSKWDIIINCFCDLH